MSTTATARLRAPFSVSRARPADPVWVRPALVLVLAVAAGLCLWDLTASGYSNTYYAAAAKAASVSWKAWFFGALDPGSFITVDKPPLSLWLQGLSARVLGFSSFSVLLPQALCTIAAVGLLFATVRRLFGPAAGLLAAGALAITPVTIAIGRVNNPDALLVLLFVAAAYLLVRALESGRTQAPRAVRCRGRARVHDQDAAGLDDRAGARRRRTWSPARRSCSSACASWRSPALAMVGVSFAWPIAVSLWPGATPYIGGSTDGSVWDLITGYNGFGRIFGESEGGGQGASFGGVPGLWRMFNEQVGGQVAWLLPLALVGLVAGLWVTRRAPRVDRARAGWILFGVWAVVHVVVFSAQQGIFHPYYVSALAPAVAALAGAGAVTLWQLGAPLVGGPGRARPGAGAHRVRRRGAAASHAGLRAVAAHRDPGGGGARRVRVARAPAAGRLPAPHARRGGRRRRARRGGRAGGLQRQHREPGAQRQRRHRRARPSGGMGGGPGGGGGRAAAARPTAS